MHINPIADKNWYIPNQQIIQYKQRYNQDANATVQLVKPKFLIRHNLEPTISGNDRVSKMWQMDVTAQSTHLVHQSLHMNHL